MIAMLFPQRSVDMALGVERSDELISVPRRALGELFGAGEIEPDTFESVRQRSHGLVSFIIIMLAIMPRPAKSVLIWISPKSLVHATMAQA